MKYLTVVILLIVFYGTFHAMSPSRTTTPAWEYRVMVKKCNDEKTLNALGADGWELATYSTWPLSTGSVDTCVFKRTK